SPRPAGSQRPPAAPEAQQQRGRGQDHHEQHEGDGRGAPQVPPAEAFLEHVVQHADRALQRIAAGHHVGLGEQLEVTRDRDHPHHQQHRPQLRQGDVEELAPARSAVDARGLVQVPGDGLQAIPRDLYEAARIDGASRWRQFLHITLPQLGPVLLVVGVITVSGYFQLFAEPYVMTRGDPLQSTVSVLYHMFEEGFRWWNLGRASAIAFVLFVVILAATTLL